jgi:hypothetical protein
MVRCYCLTLGSPAVEPQKKHNETMPDSNITNSADSKCPACGWRLDPEAYRCPQCLIYFCSSCRKRVQKDSDQFQCVNRSCDCHGKLVCLDCIETTLVTVPAEIGPWMTIVSGVAVGLIVSIWSWLWGLVSAVVIIWLTLLRFYEFSPFWSSSYFAQRCVRCKEKVERPY